MSSLVSVQLALVLAIGFAVAGVCASGYQLLMAKPPSFRLLAGENGVATFAAVPFLALAAPFIIMRNTIRGRRIEQRPLEFVMLATFIAGSWSLATGVVVIATLQAFGFLGT